ncbi:DUF4124 domain-containing protein [Comamonadaceae bacterium OTU4NAUVB1]|jgi:hypothetical protein|nr:DUF4124 domain-containing protein [Comamonadaceae bacterium OTU4NAUVB1]
MKRVAAIVPGGIRVGLAGAAVCVLAASGTSAQPVYRCTAGRAVVYSHEPCLDARVVDVTPTQGMDRFSGVSRKGADVRRTEQRALMANALRPLTGMDEEQYARAGDRQRLDPQARETCRRLDVLLPQQEARTAQAGTETQRQSHAAALLETRQHRRRLRC